MLKSVDLTLIRILRLLHARSANALNDNLTSRGKVNYSLVSSDERIHLSRYGVRIITIIQASDRQYRRVTSTYGVQTPVVGTARIHLRDDFTRGVDSFLRRYTRGFKHCDLFTHLTTG